MMRVPDPELDSPAVVTSHNPATGEVVFGTPSATDADVAEAVSHAAAAQSDWASAPVDERAAVIATAGAMIEADRSPLAELITREVGKLRSEAEREVAWTVESCGWYAAHPPPEDAVGGALVRRRPIGVVAAITPWNVPLITPAWKLLPALVAGNAVVWKPSELATGTAMALARRLHAAGVPADVLLIVPGGPAVGATLAAQPGVDALHFTGSTSAGRALAQATAPRFVRLSLEMGGSNPAIVFEDADPSHAGACIADTVTSLQGQRCTATRRVVVHEGVADAVVDEIGRRFEALRMGDPLDPSTTLGPLVSAAVAERARDLVTQAIARGVRAVASTPSKPTPGLCAGAFAPALLLEDVPDDDPLWTDELFAPVVAVRRFAHADEAFALANHHRYGLAAAVYTDRPDLRAAALERIATGVLVFNGRGDHAAIEAPFGGVRESGYGAREGGLYAYAGVTELQTVYDLAEAS